ncbi:Domain of unknown function DUF3815 [Phaffia rhodozyma]|uniref:DUF1212-domain-containing protein n=1 Tax=Phaffia rhodozyma TaxID=264483 RepID=A0A0F7SW14_PHARH|nr:Domain of unknown function DUF3815 [Phaffia rhodozyma]
MPDLPEEDQPGSPQVIITRPPDTPATSSGAKDASSTPSPEPSSSDEKVRDLSDSPNGKRVQWPEELAQTKSIPAGQEVLDFAESNFAQSGRSSDSRDPLDQAESHPGQQPTDESPSDERAELSEAEETNLLESMEVFVDPDETNGLPVLNPEREARRIREEAEARASGKPGLFRRRMKKKNAGQTNTSDELSMNIDHSTIGGGAPSGEWVAPSTYAPSSTHDGSGSDSDRDEDYETRERRKFLTEWRLRNSQDPFKLPSSNRKATSTTSSRPSSIKSGTKSAYASSELSAYIRTPAGSPPISPSPSAIDLPATTEVSDPTGSPGQKPSSLGQPKKNRLQKIANTPFKVAQAPLKIVKSAVGTPTEKALKDISYFAGAKTALTPEQLEEKAWEKEKKKRQKREEKKRKETQFITKHVAEVVNKQNFLMKLMRALMMFGAPSHRLEAQMLATARILEISCQLVYIPSIMLISFEDPLTKSSQSKFLKQANGLDLGKLLSAHMIYWNVVHDKIGVDDASAALDVLMTSKPTYTLWQNLLIGGLASAFILPSAFYGSFIDCLVTIPLGMLLVFVQVIVCRNDLYASLFEVVIAIINTFLAALFSSWGDQLCFSALVSGGVVLILPGFIVLCGSLELGNRSIISGSVRLVFALLYALFLGFGLSIGSTLWVRISGRPITWNYDCSPYRKDNPPWYRATIPQWYYFLTAPSFVLLLALRNGQPLVRKETLIMVVIGCAGFVANTFSGRAFTNRPDLCSCIGACTVGLLGGLYARFSRGSAFVMMVPGILFQLPSGLADNGGLLKFASEATSGDADSYASGFDVAEQLIEVALGLTVGLFLAGAFLNLFVSQSRRGTNLSSF